MGTGRGGEGMTDGEELFSERVHRSRVLGKNLSDYILSFRSLSITIRR